MTVLKNIIEGPPVQVQKRPRSEQLPKPNACWNVLVLQTSAMLPI